MSTRLVLAVLAFLSSLLLFMFSSLMKKRSVSFALICAKHNWDADEKASSMRLAAFMYLFAGCAAVFGEVVWGWALRTPTGIALCRGWTRCYHKIFRLVFGSRPQGAHQLKSSDNSEDDDDYNNEMMMTRGSRSSNNRNPGVGSASHSRTGSLGAARPRAVAVDNYDPSNLTFGGAQRLPTEER